MRKEFRTTQLNIAAWLIYHDTPPDRAEVLSTQRIVFVWNDDDDGKASALSALFLRGKAHTDEWHGGVELLFDAYNRAKALLFSAQRRNEAVCWTQVHREQTQTREGGK